MVNDKDDILKHWDGTLIPGRDGLMMEFSPMTKLVVDGFKASGVCADIRGKGDDRPDMGLIVAERGADAVGMFTTNTMAAAPVRVCMERVGGEKVAATIPTLVFRADQSHVCFVDEGRSLERLARQFLRQFLGSEKTQLFIN